MLAGAHRIVRGSSFTVDALAAIDVGDADEQVFSQAGRRRAAVLPGRSAPKPRTSRTTAPASDGIRANRWVMPAMMSRGVADRR